MCDLSVTDDGTTLGFIHPSSAKLPKVIAIFYAKLSAEKLLNINKMMTNQNKQNDEFQDAELDHALIW